MRIEKKAKALTIMSYLFAFFFVGAWSSFHNSRNTIELIMSFMALALWFFFGILAALAQLELKVWGKKWR